jgi:hypothetical protein
MHPKLTALGEASLKGWKGRVVRPAADVVARRTRYSADQIRAVVGLALFALSVYVLGSTVRQALRSEELTDLD